MRRRLELGLMTVACLIYISYAMIDCPSKCRCKFSTSRANINSVLVYCNNTDSLSIPKIVPENTTDVNLHGNKLKIIRNVSFKHWTASILFLDLSYCETEYIGIRAFESLLNLEKLLLNGNNLQTVRNVILPGSLKSLNLAKNPLVYYPNENLLNVSHQLSELDVSGTNLSVNAVETIKNIKHILLTCDIKEEEELMRRNINLKCIPRENTSENQVYTKEAPHSDASSGENIIISVTTETQPVTHAEDGQPTTYSKVTEQISVDFVETEKTKCVNIVSATSYSSFAAGLVTGIPIGVIGCLIVMVFIYRQQEEREPGGENQPLNPQ